MSKEPFSIPKWCGLLGALLAEIYMFFTVAGPRLQSADMPLDSLLLRLGALALLFGPFGLAAGTGVGLLLNGLLRSRASPGTECTVTDNPVVPDSTDSKPQAPQSDK